MSKSNSNSGCLFFYHIEKTAGTTFNDILERQYKGRFTYHLHGRLREEEIARFKAKTKKERHQYRCITGHMSHLLADDTAQPVKYVTFLRNPMTQVVSSYNYAKNVPRTKAHDRIRKLKSIDEYFEWQIKDSRDNIQTRYLANITRFMEGQTGRVNLQSSEGEKYLEIAKQKLRSIDHVFITEEFDPALVMMRQSLNWKKNIYYSRRNISRHKETFTKKQKNKLRKIFRYDFEIYELAKQRHQQAKEAYLGDLEKDVARYQKLNKFAGPVVSTIKPEHWIRSVIHRGRQKGIFPS